MIGLVPLYEEEKTLELALSALAQRSGEHTVRWWTSVSQEKDAHQ